MHERRPVSPHIQVYRPQITSVLSITHRATGVILSLGSLFVVIWLFAGALGEPPYDRVLDAMRSWGGLVALFAWTFSAFFHLCNGIRHLFWDAGCGFELKSIYLSGWSVVLISMALTASAWLTGLLMSGGGP